MEKTLEARTARARLLCGLASLAVGSVPLILSWPYLFTGGDEQISAWLASAAGLIAVGTGVWLLTGARSRGEEQVLTQDRSRTGYAAVMIGVCVLLLAGSLSLDQPTVSTGVAPLLITNCFRMLFERDERANK
ncbi:MULTISPECIES: hypothetical protein [unclassified Arthrobacter]|uniref:hypothetical protein n=1 Tax=unclassified Arthrobacter TaxID=235627 RepID=UPI001D133140|nr:MULTISPECIES: hypothetical protein [unclassified Arthrobacter]MCC3275689.1 hypothetical protein [Arthrobacter sp. zg-Y20]MCC3278882.1 hypothetical protein [Arthrobacter sp. zg-Y40]MCC9177260.1 hypothetical protein [Arthrobacter sp. zg-Y750]MDK1315846.1 hypothetical protein [Arthrobacter sp. zg.Y20]MDK1326046.1 hypothetical protein [Arthrobacter sp. zg-Y1143]